MTAGLAAATGRKKQTGERTGNFLQQEEAEWISMKR